MKIIPGIMAILSFLQTFGQDSIALYPKEIPNSISGPDKEYHETSEGILRVFNVSRPTLTIYPAKGENKTNAAVIICPGGGYYILASGHEGDDVALALNEKGITAFVLKYRIPNSETMPDKKIGPLQDAQRAMQYVRENAAKYGIDPNKIGMLGFSAGGHLTAMAGTTYKKSLIPNKKRTNLRPDFLVLVYPVINLSDSMTHPGSRRNLLGSDTTAKTINKFSADLQVNSRTPPTFLVHAMDDEGVSYLHSERFYQRLRQEDIATTFYQYREGGHGFGLINPTSSVRWLDVLEKWLQEIGITN